MMTPCSDNSSDHSPERERGRGGGGGGGGGPSAYTRAPKGKACLNCRRRKLKCDCAHPVCSPCIRFGREKDCEYSDKDRRSRSEILEERIAFLQSRLQELENVNGNGAAAMLQFGGWGGGGSQDDLGDMSVPVVDAGLGGLSPGPAQIPVVEPTLAVAQHLVEAFLTSACDFGFFLNRPRFLTWIAQQLPSQSAHLPSFSTAPSEPNPLLSVIYLWGTALTADEELKAQVDLYLARAVRDISTAFRPSVTPLPVDFSSALGVGVEVVDTPSSPGKPDMVHFIQAEVLLAHFYYSAGRFAQARRHSASAVSLALSCGLHKLRPMFSSSSSSSSSSPVRERERGRERDMWKMHLMPFSELALTLPPPLDLIEEGERICAFWQVYVMDKGWSHVMGVSSMLVDEDENQAMRVDTPWPLAMEHYVEGTMPHEYGIHGRTIQRFMTDVESSRLGPRVSTLALRAQAAVLLDRAARLSSRVSADPSILRAHQTEFDHTDALIEKFILGLPSLALFQNSTPCPPGEFVRCLVVTHALARVAMIQLHVAYMDEMARSATKCLSAAKAILEAISCVPHAALGSVDPIMVVLLTASAQMIIAELVHVKDSPVYKRPGMVCSNPWHLASVLEELIALMGVMNPGTRLTAQQLETVQNARAVLAGADFE